MKPRRLIRGRVSGATVIGLLAALLACAPATAPARTPSSRHPLRPHLAQELRELVAMPGGPPGAIAIIQRGRSRRVYRAGVSNLRSRAPMGPDQYMRVASVSKAFSGAVALALVDRGMLSLSDTIARWLPQLPAAWGPVTLGEALSHTSGLPDFSESKGFVDHLKKHLRGAPSPIRLLRFVFGEGLAFTPGSRYRYSNTDNFVVALMAEAATHRSYNSLLSSLVYSPLHLTHTRLPVGPGLPAPRMHGYDLAPPHPPDDVTTLASAAYSWASGGVISTPADLNRFVRGYVGARLFSRAVQRQQLGLIRGSSGPPGPGENFAGLAIFRYRTRCGTIYGHTGNTFGYTQFIASTLDGRRSVVVSVDAQLNDHSPQPLLAAWRRLRKIETDAVCAALR